MRKSMNVELQTELQAIKNKLDKLEIIESKLDRLETKLDRYVWQNDFNEDLKELQQRLKEIDEKLKPGLKTRKDDQTTGKVNTRVWHIGASGNGF
jgi:ABC-type phosphate transport system auxiliary subunit